jgi:hypothetical protein
MSIKIVVRFPASQNRPATNPTSNPLERILISGWQHEMERVKQEDSLDPPLERFLLRNGSQTTERGLSDTLSMGEDLKDEREICHVEYKDHLQLKMLIIIFPC